MIELFLIGIFSIISCFLFGKLQIKSTVNELFNSYKNQYKLILDSSIDDEVKQKQLFKNIAFQLKHLGILILKIIALVSPFILFYLSDIIGLNLDTNKLVEIAGVSVSLLSILFFIIAQNLYGKLFPNK